MDLPNRGYPPLSPALLAGMAAAPLPPALLQPFLDVAVAAVGRSHPDLFARLSRLGGRALLIDPVELPFSFLLRLGPPPRLLTVGDESRFETPDAVIRGPLPVLVQLLEGRLDGDALFFSRALAVEGDMESVVTLRNAVDGADINVLEDILSVLGPLARPAGALARGARSIFARMDRDLALLRRALVAPVAERCEAQAAEISRLRETVAELRRTLDRHERRGRRRAAAGAG